MNRYAIVTLAALVFAPPSSRVYAADELDFIYTPGTSEPERWHLVMADGQIAFTGRWKDAAQDQSKLPRFPVDDSVPRAAYHLRHSGDTLQVFLTDSEKAKSKVQADKDGWYLTGKYTDKGGEVILTKDVEDLSHWGFVPVGKWDPEVRHFNIKNLGMKKDAWLWMEDKGTRFRGGREIRKAILSFEKKETLAVEGGPHSGSK